MKIIISGYGRMGKEVEKLALSMNHDIIARLDSEQDWAAAGNTLRAGDAVIDFSFPSAAVGNIRRAFDLGLPVVIGTTGWDSEKERVKQWCLTENRSLIAASNFSIGVNMMLELTEKLAKMAERFGGYDISIEEIHHVHKLDAPSGTAIRIAETIIDNLDGKKEWVAGKSDDPAALQVFSIREGEETGTHIVRAESEQDSLEIIHRARSRRGFAAGALLAAEWIQGRTGFFSMKDLLE